MIKVKLGDQIKWSEHRSGWAFVLGLFQDFDNESGIAIEGFIDISFTQPDSSRKNSGIIPFKEDWIGFLHSPISNCPFMSQFPNINTILTSKDFLDSLDYCKGIFTLSEHVARFVRLKLGSNVEIESIKHPTETTEKLFDFHKFSKTKNIIHIGNWQRKILSFLILKTKHLKKSILMTPLTLEFLNSELNYYKVTDLNFKDVFVIKYLNNEDYDNILSESIVFIDLCDSNATNTIIECIVRNTPIVVNWNEAISEYLGDDYPLYFNSLSEAEEKISNWENIYKAHEYLQNLPRKLHLTKEYFINSFCNSKIVKELIPYYGIYS